MRAAVTFSGVVLLYAAFSGLPCQAQETPESTKAMEETIQAELKKQTIQEWIKTPLKDVVGVISQQHKIPIKIDVKALQDKNLTPDLKITANSKGTTLRQALQSMLRDTGLTYVVKDGALMITTRDAAKRKSESKSPTPNAK